VGGGRHGRGKKNEDSKPQVEALVSNEKSKEKGGI